MAHMMLFYELMNVKREYNAESRNQIAITQKMNRMQKQIDNTTKYYTSLFSQLDSQAKSMQNQANMMFQSMTGGFNFNPYDLSGSSMIAQFIPQLFASGDFVYGQDKAGKDQTISKSAFEKMQQIAAKHNGNLSYYENGKTVYYDGLDESDVSAFSAVKYAATQMQSQMKMMASQMSNMFQNGISSWLECQKTALQAEQDEALDALNYEETMLECDQSASKVRMEELKAEKESLQEELKERIQDDAPGFGL